MYTIHVWHSVHIRGWLDRGVYRTLVYTIQDPGILYRTLVYTIQDPGTLYRILIYYILYTIQDPGKLYRTLVSRWPRSSPTAAAPLLWNYKLPFTTLPPNIPPHLLPSMGAVVKVLHQSWLLFWSIPKSLQKFRLPFTTSKYLASPSSQFKGGKSIKN